MPHSPIKSMDRSNRFSNNRAYTKTNSLVLSIKSILSNSNNYLMQCINEVAITRLNNNIFSSKKGAGLLIKACSSEPFIDAINTTLEKYLTTPECLLLTVDTVAFTIASKPKSGAKLYKVVQDRLTNLGATVKFAKNVVAIKERYFKKFYIQFPSQSTITVWHNPLNTKSSTHRDIKFEISSYALIKDKELRAFLSCLRKILGKSCLRIIGEALPVRIDTAIDFVDLPLHFLLFYKARTISRTIGQNIVNKSTGEVKSLPFETVYLGSKGCSQITLYDKCHELLTALTHEQKNSENASILKQIPVTRLESQLMLYSSNQKLKGRWISLKNIEKTSFLMRELQLFSPRLFLNLSKRQRKAILINGFTYWFNGLSSKRQAKLKAKFLLAIPKKKLTTIRANALLELKERIKRLTVKSNTN